MLYLILMLGLIKSDDNVTLTLAVVCQNILAKKDKNTNQKLFQEQNHG